MDCEAKLEDFMSKSWSCGIELLRVGEETSRMHSSFSRYAVLRQLAREPSLYCANILESLGK